MPVAWQLPVALRQPICGRGRSVSMEDVRHWTGGSDVRSGLIPSFDRLDSPGFDASAVDPELRAFYEQTAQKKIEMRSVRWEPWATPLMLAYRWTAQHGLGNLFMPPTTDAPRRMTSDVFPVTWGGSPETRLWVRTFTGSHDLFYVASLREAVVEGRSYLSVAFPVRRGHVLVVLRLSNTHGGGMVADSTDDRFAGTYLVQSLAGRTAILPGPPTAERLCFAPRADGSVDGTHEGSLGSRRTFLVEYRLK